MRYAPVHTLAVLLSRARKGRTYAEPKARISDTDKTRSSVRPCGPRRPTNHRGLSMKRTHSRGAGLFLAAAALFCSARSVEAAEVKENAVVHWNSIAATAFLPADPTQGIDPLTQSRVFAMVHAAIHDALNAIDPQYMVYTSGLSSAPHASPEAAVAAAAHDVLVVTAPTQRKLLDEAYRSELTKLPD